MISGIGLGIFEILFIFLGGYLVRHYCYGLHTMNLLSYSWFVVSIVTGFLWETAYIGNYKWVGIVDGKIKVWGTFSSDVFN